MQPAIEAKGVSLEAFEAAESQLPIEIIDGERIDMTPVGLLHHFITGNTYDALKPYVVQNQLGFVFMDGLLYYLDADAQTLKGAQVPDVSFIRRGRIPKDWNIERPFPGAPDLAVEVVSPGDDAELLELRVQRYLQFGSEQVWVLYPRQHTLYIFQRDEPASARIFRVGQTFTSERLFPGLTLAVDDLFAVPSLGQEQR